MDCINTAGDFISIHALREEGDLSGGAYTTHRLNFYPRPPRGGRRWCPVWQMILTLFLSTPSARRATRRFIGLSSLDQFLSTPSARRATTALFRVGGKAGISIHALREEGDDASLILGRVIAISIHALREEGDGGQSFSDYTEALFLSTPSARRATRMG